MSVPSTALTTPIAPVAGINTSSILKMLAAGAPQLSQAGKEFAAISALDQRFAAADLAFDELSNPIKKWQTTLRSDLQALAQEIPKPHLTPAMKASLTKSLEEFGSSATKLEPELNNLQLQSTQFKNKTLSIKEQIRTIKTMAKDPVLLRNKVQNEVAVTQAIAELDRIKKIYTQQQLTVAENCQRLHKEIVRTLPSQAAKIAEENAPNPDRMEPS